ncbi:MAG TPA: PhzF family phenazine biosynthesis protein, partial [Thermoanaerobaculia bacterium]|nr:PhzF family phenazine biosynthesis protein [Thermoanaerobaculia bacterium]
FHVDAFTDRPFAGNPAGVCFLEEERPDSWMQNIASEMNLAETAFLRRSGPRWSLRWFTPSTEVDLCGHATLASAHILWESGRAAPETTLAFETKSGLLTAARRDDLIELDFPAEPAVAGPLPPDVLDAIGISAPRFTGRNRLDDLIEVAREAHVRALEPDFRRLKAATAGSRGVIVTAAATETAGFDFISRFFAPAAGIDEDPVTGSAHCCLGPFWGARLGKRSLSGYQASARGGAVAVRLIDSRVMLGGRAVTVARGEIA